MKKTIIYGAGKVGKFYFENCNYADAKIIAFVETQKM